MAEETSGAEGMMVDTDLVRQLAALLTDSDLSEIVIPSRTRRCSPLTVIEDVPSSCMKACLCAARVAAI